MAASLEMGRRPAGHHIGQQINLEHCPVVPSSTRVIHIFTCMMTQKAKTTAALSQRSIDHHSDRDGVSTSGRIVMMAGATGADADKEKRA